MTAKRLALGSCCGMTASSMCFWAAVFLLTYGILLALRSAWPALDPYHSTLLLAALGIACLADAGRNRTYHCYLTAPLFLAGAAVAALMESHVWPIRAGLLWGLVLIGVGVAFAMEWRASRPPDPR